VRSKLTYIVTIAISSILCIYFILRAHLLSFTHDEALSFLRFMDWNIIEILTMKEVDSNNHALNSILMKFCYFFFGSSELSLRLPNLIAGSLFIIYSLRISKLFGSSFILGSLIVLLGNHHLIDFFSIARGYGLALAFQLIAL
jgi:hypothetical protein